MTKQQRSTQPAVPTEPAPLTRRKMKYREVLNFSTPYYPMFGPLQFFETAVFAALGSWCKAYDGGSWTYYMLSNGAWYLAPSDDSHDYPSKDFYGCKHSMSADGAGLAATLYVVNMLSWKFHEAGDKVRCAAAAEHYHALRMYTYTHPDAVAIWRVLD